MPAKKKKGKASKLARMSDEERLRYLQHRAELEQEAKRRKQQLIAVFTKNKLKREEAFSRLNTAKINEQWRHILRQIKCKQLHQDVTDLWETFDSTLRKKDAVIHKLYDELEIADCDHRRSQEAHIMMIDKLIGVQKQRLKFMHDNYLKELRELDYMGTVELSAIKQDLEDGCKHLDTIIFAQNQSLDKSLAKTRTQNAVLTHNIIYSKEEALIELTHHVGSGMEDLWSQLNAVISDYESTTESKRKQYEYLKEQDDAVRMETGLFPRQQSQLLEAIDTLKAELDDLSWKRGERVAELKKQVEQINGRIWNLRQETKLAQTTDAIQLKRLSVVSNGVIKDLERLVEKGSALQVLIRVCSNLEPPSATIKKYSIQNVESSAETNRKYVTNPYNNMEKFWQRYNEVKADNILMRKERDELSFENKRLRHILRTYLIAVARMPAPRPHTAL